MKTKGDIGAILNRLGQLELKASRVDQLENTVQNQQVKMNQLELKVKDQQIEIDQLKKKNVKLENKLESISSATSYPTQLRNKNSNIVASASVSGRDFLHRSCYELKATNPSAQSGLYFIDPDGQINGDDPVQAYCDMDTSKLLFIYRG